MSGKLILGGLVVAALSASLGTMIGYHRAKGPLLLNEREPKQHFEISSEAGYLPGELSTGQGLRWTMIRFFDGSFDLKICKIAGGATTLLHQERIDSACFPMAMIHDGKGSDGNTLVAMAAHSVLRSSQSAADIQPKFWSLDLGAVRSFHWTPQQGLGESPGFQRSVEYPVIAYRYSMKADEAPRPDIALFGRTSGALSESGMREVSKKEPDVEFLMVTVKAVD